MPEIFCDREFHIQTWMLKNNPDVLSDLPRLASQVVSEECGHLPAPGESRLREF